MRIAAIIALFAVMLAGTAFAGAGSSAKGVNFGGYNVILGITSPGTGDPPMPGGKVRGFTMEAQYFAITTGPASDLGNGFAGPVIMNANLDKNMAGPVWMTFDWSKPGGFTYAGTCNGQYDWLLNVGHWLCEGTIQGPGLGHILVKNHTVIPGADNPGYSFGTILGFPED
jgi:hypothetical protein